jgi:MFS family permease
MCSAVVGGVLLAFATTLSHGLVAMGLIGAGCAPVLMTGYYLIARTYPGARFATMSSLLLGLGSLGDPLSGTPLALAVGAFGWRSTMLAIAAITAASVACVALACAIRLASIGPAEGCRPSPARGRSSPSGRCGPSSRSRSSAMPA